jgi:hypothetical protein
VMLFTRMAIPATHSRTEHPFASNRSEAPFSIGGWHLSQLVGGTFLISQLVGGTFLRLAIAFINWWVAPFSGCGWHRRNASD